MLAASALATRTRTRSVFLGDDDAATRPVRVRVQARFLVSFPI